MAHKFRLVKVTGNWFCIDGTSANDMTEAQKFNCGINDSEFYYFSEMWEFSNIITAQRIKDASEIDQTGYDYLLKIN